MKKIFGILFFIFLFSSYSFAQNNFKPSFQVVAKGSFSFPLGDTYFGDSFTDFPSAQAELQYNLNPHLQVYGNFTYDLILPKERYGNLLTGTEEFINSHQISFYIGPRFYLHEYSKKARCFIDAGIGIYSFTPGGITRLGESRSLYFKTSYTAYSQTGINFGGGADFSLNKKLFLNFGIKYHYIIKRENVATTETEYLYGNNTISTSIFNAPDRKYFQFSTGIGYKF